MPLPAPAFFAPYTVLCRIEGSVSPTGTKMLNSLHVRTPNEEPDSADVDNISDIVSTWCDSEYKSFLATYSLIDRVVAQSIFEAIAPYSVKTTGATGAIAVDTSNGWDPAWAPLALFDTGYTGRTNHGRFYSFPPSNAAEYVLATGKYTSTLLATLRSALEGLQTSLSDNGYFLAIASSTEGVSKQVMGITTSTKLALQTRRREGFGDW